MPHICQRIGWILLSISLSIEIIKIVRWYFTHDVDRIEGYLAQTVYILLIVSLFFISLSKERVEDEMISILRLRALGITGYSFFILILLLSLVLTFGDCNLYFSELFLMTLPLLLATLYYLIFKWMLWRSKKEEKV